MNGFSQECDRRVCLALARRVDDAQPIAGPNWRADIYYLGQADRRVNGIIGVAAAYAINLSQSRLAELPFADSHLF